MARIRSVIPLATRRQLAVRYGCHPGQNLLVGCHWCGKEGLIRWWVLSSGNPSCWVIFDHDIDHVIPRACGGTHALENLVLACEPCNASRFHRPMVAA